MEELFAGRIKSNDLELSGRYPSQEEDFFDDNTAKLGPLDLSDKHFRELISHASLPPKFKIEKAAAERLGGSIVVSVEGFNSSSGNRSLYKFFNDRILTEIHYFGPPDEFEKHLPLFQQSLETIQYW